MKRRLAIAAASAAAALSFAAVAAPAASAAPLDSRGFIEPHDAFSVCISVPVGSSNISICLP